MSTMDRPVALVTGASSGIGLELSRLLAADGYDLALVGRNAAALQAQAADLTARHGVSVRNFPRDLAAPGAPQALWTDLQAEGLEVGLLVNNAGSGLYGSLQHIDPEALAAMLELNVVALTALTRLALPGMLRRRKGRILNVASVVSYQPGGPRMAAYYASKAYVLSFSKGLARELRGTGVSVTALCPGTTRTAFAARSGAGDSFLYRRLPGMSARAVAVAGYRGLMRGAPVVIPGLFTKIVALAGELPPRAIALSVNDWILRRTGTPAVRPRP
jgi:short-subunit dehydrogenase